MFSIKIRTRLILNILLFGGSLGVISWGLSVHNSVNEQIQLDRENANAILVNTLQLRRAEKDYMLRVGKDVNYFETGEIKYIGKFDSFIEENRLVLESLRSSEILQEYNLLSKIDSVEEYFATYQGKFNQITTATFERGFKDYGMVGEMRSAVHGLEKIITEDRHLADVLMLRRHEKDYLLRRDMKYNGKMISQVEEMKSYMLDETHQAILDEYYNAFYAITQFDERLGRDENSGLNGDLRAAIHQVEPAVQGLINEIETIGNEKLSDIDNTIINSLIALFSIVFIVSIWIIISILKPLKEANKALLGLSQGDLNQTIVSKSKDEIGVMLSNLAIMLSKLREIVSSIKIGSANISEASHELSSSSQRLAAASSDQASSTEEISSSMEQMVANIKHNTQNAQETEKISNGASEDILRSSSTIEETLESMQTIADRITVIGDISRQTNLLALNAAVEAARAGDHGKGFAVVAEEVRNLAAKSHIAAEEIDSLSISSVNIAQKSGKLLSEMVPNIQRTAQLVQNIATASVEQDMGADQINNALQHMNNIVQENAATAEELSSSSEELSAQAEQMMQSLKFFKIDIDSGNGNSKFNSYNSKMPTVFGSPVASKESVSEHEFEDEFFLENDF